MRTTAPLGVIEKVATELVPASAEVLLAVVVERVPLEALAVARTTSRGALYKLLFDARRKLRRHLVTHHYLDENGPDENDPDEDAEEAR
jgi:RNA polymerase sigma-70 factor (ECF subfamily)